ncbi:MAG: MurR/RpiR family transcriptional regulator [Rhodococcus sp. (in: high G+C Gram-positive bacteria)]|nr:MAG: MurR/RpiR family transcriptional regulator [Rhodococcus sp. (in: high G+C Gram-positive bacteria)]
MGTVTPNEIRIPTIAAIRVSASRLTPGQKRVADYCMERPQEVAWGSVADLAAHSHTSSATVVRACRSLGYTGFQHLRSALLRELGASARTPASSRLRNPASSLGVVRTTPAEMSAGAGDSARASDGPSGRSVLRAARFESQGSTHECAHRSRMSRSRLLPGATGVMYALDPGQEDGRLPSARLFHRVQIVDSGNRDGTARRLSYDEPPGGRSDQIDVARP